MICLPLSGKATAITRCIAMTTTWVNDDVRENAMAAYTGFLKLFINNVLSTAINATTKLVIPRIQNVMDAKRSAMFRLSRAIPKTEFLSCLSRQIKMNWIVFVINPSEPVAVNMIE